MRRVIGDKFGIQNNIVWLQSKRTLKVQFLLQHRIAF